MAKAPETEQKNRRYRNAKISERILRGVVLCFAQEMSAKATAAKKRLSQPTVESIFRKLRQRVAEYPMVRLIPNPDEPTPARFIFNRQHRGVAKQDIPFHEMDVLTRILNAQNFSGFERLSASNPDHVKRAIALMKMKANGHPRYNIYEELAAQPGDTSPRTRAFDPLEYKPTSAILVNEMKADPHHAYFVYLWKLLLDHPL